MADEREVNTIAPYWLSEHAKTEAELRRKDRRVGFWVLMGLLAAFIGMVMAEKVLAEDYLYAEVTVGQKINGINYLCDNPTELEIGMHKEVTRGFYIRPYVNHSSNLACGKPFNNEPETSFEHIGVTFGWKGFFR